MKLKILVASHKNVKVPDSDIYLPIQVGAALTDEVFSSPYIQDDTGDNISEKNKRYNELTALYWAWKNLKDVDYVGLCHYRRYFYPLSSNIKNFIRKTIKKFLYYSSKTMPVRIRRNITYYKHDIVSYGNIFKNSNSLERNLKNLLESYDVIVPYKNLFSKYSLKDHYKKYHKEEDFYLLTEELIKSGIDRGKIDSIFNKKYLRFCNMVIMRKDILDEYCNWLFPLLFSLERSISYESRDEQESRVLGFLAERLLSIWIDLNEDKFKIKETRIANIKEYMDIKYPAIFKSFI